MRRRTEAIWFARFSSEVRSSPGGFWDFGIGATVGGPEEPVRGRFFGVMTWLKQIVGWGGVCSGRSVDDCRSYLSFQGRSHVTPRNTLHVRK